MRRPSRETLFPARVPHKAPEPGSWNQLGRPSPQWIHALPGGDTPGSPGATPLEKPPDAAECAPADGRGSAPVRHDAPLLTASLSQTQTPPPLPTGHPA